MITPEFLQRMARYNLWQNESLFRAADTLSDQARRADRGSFFKSVHATLSHILWADRLWMSRLSDWESPSCGIEESATLYEDWGDLKAARAKADAAFISWADQTTAKDFAGDLTWFSGAMGREMLRPKAICMMQVFNHQTHHRGQVHAMLTAAGTKPEDTDLPFMPESYL